MDSSLIRELCSVVHVSGVSQDSQSEFTMDSSSSCSWSQVSDKSDSNHNFTSVSPFARWSDHYRIYQHLPRVRESLVQQPDRPVSAKTRRAPVTGPGTRRSDGTHWISGVCENILVTRNSVLSGCPGKCYQSSSLTASSDSSFS